MPGSATHSAGDVRAAQDDVRGVDRHRRRTVEEVVHMQRCVEDDMSASPGCRVPFRTRSAWVHGGARRRRAGGYFFAKVGRL